MTATNPLLAISIDVVSWDSIDKLPIANYLSGLTNGNTSVTVLAQGADPDDILRIEFANLSTLKAIDTVSVWVTALSSYTTMALLPYDTTFSVDTSNKITLSAAVGENKFTLTQAFIDDLADQGTGNWAARIVEDGEISGSASIAEIDSDLTTSGGGEPGSPSSNDPAEFVPIRDSRLLSNGNITRMPQNQREWGTFIRELNKWIKNETGTFNPTFTGFSTDPSTASCWWHRYGQLVHMEFYFTTGTSDATTFTITNLPASITPRNDQSYAIGGMHDGGSDLTTMSAIEINADNTMVFYKSPDDGAWTNSLAKGFAATNVKKSIIYSLRNPEKL